MLEKLVIHYCYVLLNGTSFIFFNSVEKKELPNFKHPVYKDKLVYLIQFLKNTVNI